MSDSSVLHCSYKSLSIFRVNWISCTQFVSKYFLYFLRCFVACFTFSPDGNYIISCFRKIIFTCNYIFDFTRYLNLSGVYQLLQHLQWFVQHSINILFKYIGTRHNGSYMYIKFYRGDNSALLSTLHKILSLLHIICYYFFLFILISLYYHMYNVIYRGISRSITLVHNSKVSDLSLI